MTDGEIEMQGSIIRLWVVVWGLLTLSILLVISVCVIDSRVDRLEKTVDEITISVETE